MKAVLSTSPKVPRLYPTHDQRVELYMGAQPTRDQRVENDALGYPDRFLMKGGVGSATEEVSRRRSI